MIKYLCIFMFEIIVAWLISSVKGVRSMNERILDIIAKETNGKSYKTYKYCFENTEMSTIDYDDNKLVTWKKYGETRPPKNYKDLRKDANTLISQKPLFTYFLDGSRHTYKVDDIAYKNQVYPIIAGQIGISCCTRNEGEMSPFDFERRLVIALPKVACQDTWRASTYFPNLLKKINEQGYRLADNEIQFTDVISYSTKKDEFERIENKGIAAIQDLMIQKEIDMVTRMVEEHKINFQNYLLKDGSLEYKVDRIKNAREKRKFAGYFSFVVGVSKSFNPENCIDKNGKNNSNVIAELPLYHRTPVSMYTSERLPGMAYAVWYIRIRDKKYTANTFDGILKVEKILTTDAQMENGLDTDDVDLISANLVNERNPVCYGADNRWANHLYPVYVTEKYAKSKYLSSAMFMNLF